PGVGIEQCNPNALHFSDEWPSGQPVKAAQPRARNADGREAVVLPYRQYSGGIDATARLYRGAWRRGRWWRGGPQSERCPSTSSKKSSRPRRHPNASRDLFLRFIVACDRDHTTRISTIYN